MSPGSNTESYLAFAHIGLRENPGKKPQPEPQIADICNFHDSTSKGMQYVLLKNSGPTYDNNIGGVRYRLSSLIIDLHVVVSCYLSSAVASWSKASCLGLALRNARWFESSWRRNFLMKFRPVYGTWSPPSIVMHLGSYDRYILLYFYNRYNESDFTECLSVSSYSLCNNECCRAKMYNILIATLL
ncbi:hypothetical protein ANN_19809 [Periplaneta americana]|uniref:Uncharacterized protein n=1 Tax=Periplaneta americana TaxID=6978 RepID=A0ABQ8SBZ4_PERAM|nr:hypothetical protein ANN_19809 [Periplaneta americana]